MPAPLAPGKRDAASKSSRTQRSTRSSSRVTAYPVGDEEKDRIRLFLKRGLSCAQIAAELGRSPATISRHVAAMGLSFDREQTRQATEARTEDMKARRMRLAEKLLAQAEAELDAREVPYSDHAFTPSGLFVEHEAMPRPQDRMYLTRSATTMMAESRHLAEFDAEDGSAGARSMLGMLAAGLAVAAGTGDEPA